MKTDLPFSPALIVKAEGTKLYDQNGRDILDFTSGQMSSLLGHSHPEIAEVVQNTDATLDHLLSNMIAYSVAELAERLAGFLLKPLEKSFFLNTSSETTEDVAVILGILALSKTLGCGLPLASVSTTAEIEAGCAEVGFLWLTTPLNDPLTVAVGCKVLEIVSRDRVIEAAATRSEQLRRGLLELQQRYWWIGDVRVGVVFQAIEIISDAVTEAPGQELGQSVLNRALELGLSCNVVNLPGMGGVFQLAPPITVTEGEIETGLRILDEAFG
ncbi:hypothetical protein PspLS_06352 [Pyricularia sp. CBS 133598]|nr:hypothetical protein PspLS_06352 [Pyricularia sp. CBS 133598]